VCFLSDRFAEKCSTLSEKELLDEAVKHLKKAYKGKEIVVKNYIVTAWEKEEFS